MHNYRSGINIKELAKILNVSPSTISRALNNHPGISKATTKKIQHEALKRGYYPNALASNFRKQKTNLIGVIIPRIDRAFHSLAISGIEEIARKEGYYVTIFQSNNSYTREKENARHLLESRADGVIACMAQETDNYSHFEMFKKNNIPLVFFDRVCPFIETHKVIIDDFMAASKATQHLIDIGCKKIAHIGGNQIIKIFRDRYEGYLNTLKKNDYKSSDELIAFTDDLNIEEGYKAVQSFLDLSKRPDGIVCSNDQSAIGAIKAIKKAGLKVPEYIAVTGFSNTQAAEIVDPELTSIDDHAFEMGQAAAGLLIRQITTGQSMIASETIVIQNDLVIRASTVR